MSQPVISVDKLSKTYRIGLKDEIPDTLAAALTGFLKAPLRNLRQLRRLDTSKHIAGEADTYTALRSISFDVQRGDVLGVIGRNGAGKSTLLKILSRITKPTSGRAVIRGRVSSLLEVGTGFHPDLSGRDNVYLNGTILGMTKSEIDRKFDQIVDFSGIEKFLDTPIKRYSSGMKVRLAFSVAAHLEPEILIVDEVLAVGDADFQKKCIGKMRTVADGGRTVLFVSHNLSAVTQLCNRGLVIQNGEVKCDAPIEEAVSQYMIAFRERAFVNSSTKTPLRIESAFIGNNQLALENLSHVMRGDTLQVHVRIQNDGPPQQLGFGISIETSSLFRVTANCSLFTGNPLNCPSGASEFLFEMPNCPLNQGTFLITLAVHRWEGGETLDRHDQCICFQVVERSTGGVQITHRPNDGVVTVAGDWSRLT
jgi:lipopolysaccharide transport system ATP-binding protein